MSGKPNHTDQTQDERRREVLFECCRNSGGLYSHFVSVAKMQEASIPGGARVLVGLVLTALEDLKRQPHDGHIEDDLGLFTIEDVLIVARDLLAYYVEHLKEGGAA